MQLVYGTEFDHLVASGSTVDECMQKIKWHHLETANHEINCLRIELSECVAAREFGDITVVDTIADIHEEVNEWLTAIQQVEDSKTLKQLDKAIDEYIEEGYFIRHVS